MKIEEEEKLGEGKNPEEASIRKRQKFREEQNSEEGKNMEETKIRRSQLENQEEAKNQKIPNFSLYGPGRHWLKESLLFPLHTKPTVPFQGYAQCSLNIVNMFKDWIFIATFFNRGNRFNHHGIMMQRIMLNLNSKTCLKTLMSWEDMFNSLLPHLLQTLLWKFNSCDPEI